MADSTAAKDAAASDAPEVDPQFSTLKVVEDHPNAKRFADSQQSNGLRLDPGHSTLQSYNTPDKADTSEKIALDPTIAEEEKPEEKKEKWKRRRVIGVPLLLWVIGEVLAVVGGVVGSRKSKDSGDAAGDTTVSDSPTATTIDLVAVATQPFFSDGFQ